jgi:hypothetical protein
METNKKDVTPGYILTMRCKIKTTRQIMPQLVF